MRTFEEEYPDEAAFLMLIYSEPPHYHRRGAMHYFPHHWHFTHDGRCIEIQHQKCR